MAFRNANTRNAKKNLVPEYCEIPDCNFTALITRHRIKPGRRGGKYIAGNVIGLCPNHHALADAGDFSQYELFRIVHERIRSEYGDSMTKRCNKCGEEKLYEEFHKSNQTLDGLRGTCRECRSRQRREDYAQNGSTRQAIAAWRQNNPDKVKEYTRRHQLKKRYNLTEVDYDEILTQQEGVCAICGISPNGKPLHVDHDHETKEVRGLLCQSCNQGLGHFKDSGRLLYEAASYVGGWE